MPAGPRDDVLDTVASVIHYSDPSRIILVIDDTGNLAGTDSPLTRLSPDVSVIPAPPARPGPQGGLWMKLAEGYRWVLERYQPGIILRLDADALLIGSGLEAAAEYAFASDPAVGLLGAYRMGPDGLLRDFSWPARQVRAETGPRGLLRPKRWASLRRYRALARRQGYVDGEHALGGTYIHSYAAASSIYARGWFSDRGPETSNLGEDHINALLTVAAGFRLEDFSTPEGPMAIKWKGLPAHPADLLATGKLVTHSVRSWQDLTEQQIRAFFAHARALPERTD